MSMISNVTVQEHQRALLELLQVFDGICKKYHIRYALFAGTLLGAVRHQGFIPWDDDLDVVMLRPDYERFLAMAAQELDQKKYFLQKEFSEHWPMFFSKLRLNHTTCLEKYHPKDTKSHQGVYIDIFPCDNAATTVFGRKLQFFASKVVITKSLDKRGYDTTNKSKQICMRLSRYLPMTPFLKLTQKGEANSEYVHSFLGGAHGFKESVFLRKWLTETRMMEFEGDAYPVPIDYDAMLKQMYGNYMQIPSDSERKIKQHALLVDLEHSWETYEHYRDDMVFQIHTRSIR